MRAEKNRLRQSYLLHFTNNVKRVVVVLVKVAIEQCLLVTIDNRLIDRFNQKLKSRENTK